MGEKQISDKVEDISTEITPEEEQEVSFLPSYIKSYAQTQFEPYITFDYTWKIKHFGRFYKVRDKFFSPSFGEEGQYKIKMNCQINSQKLHFYIRTTPSYMQPRTGICITNIMYTTLHSPKIFLTNLFPNYTRIYDTTSPIEVPLNVNCRIDDLIVYFKFEEIVYVPSNSIHTNLSPSIMKSQDSTLEFDSKKFIKFILGDEQYVVSKRLLCATNSSYFKNICFARVGEEIDLTNELTKNDELYTFKQILLFILTGSVNLNEYDMFLKLLTTAEKYDVPTLKVTCEHYLLRNITIENAVELAFSANAKVLKTHLTTFIKFYIKEIMDTEKFQNLPQEDKNKIMELIE